MAQMPVFNDFTARQGEIARRRKMAEMLQLEGMKPLEQQTAGGMVVPISPAQGLAKMLQTYIGTKGLENAAAQDQAIASEKSQALAQALGAMPQATTSTETKNVAPWLPNDDEGNVNPSVPVESKVTTKPTAQQYATWLAGLGNIGQDAVQIGSGVMNFQQKEDENQAGRDSKLQELRLRLMESRQTADERNETLRQIAQLNDDTRRWQVEQETARRRWELQNRPAPQGPAPQVIQTESGPMQVDRFGRATPIVGPDGRQVAPKSTEKALPTSAAQKLMENRQNLRRAENALALIEGKDVTGPDGRVIKGDANATGWKGYAPDFILQRTDQAGIDTRAAIGDLGSLVIHDRSGAAVTAAEFPRLRPFIPLPTDDPQTAKKKLGRFVQEYRALVNDAETFYGESGYKVPGRGASSNWGASQNSGADTVIEYDKNGNPVKK